MTTRTFKQTPRGAYTRRLLLDSTTECLVSYGYGGTTTAAICSTAGMTAGALFGQFPNKTALIVEVASGLAEQAAALVEGAFFGLPDELDRALAGLFDNLMEVWRTPTVRALSELWSAARTDPALARALVAADAGSDAFLSDLGRRYLRSAEHLPLHSLARMVIDAVAGRTALEDARLAAGLDVDTEGRAELRATLASIGSVLDAEPLTPLA